MAATRSARSGARGGASPHRRRGGAVHPERVGQAHPVAQAGFLRPAGFELPDARLGQPYAPWRGWSARSPWLPAGGGGARRTSRCNRRHRRFLLVLVERPVAERAPLAGRARIGERLGPRGRVVRPEALSGPLAGRPGREAAGAAASHARASQAVKPRSCQAPRVCGSSGSGVCRNTYIPGTRRFPGKAECL